uniref:Major capsid protein p72 homolog protein n=1 Tax=Abalone asfa-like virus TaxID=2839893 RepID=A0A5K7XYJ1_9VIRU|nr:major capsid protein p72 homolog protein [Abalone asfa-like virus]BCY04570.1 putative major capsid protein p72 [Abalone asfa-like virus]
MAAGGPFILITNNGKADNMLMATKYLNNKIQYIRWHKTMLRDPNPDPDLYDLEKTHVLFMNAHFKPFVAVGCEYQKIKAKAGSMRLGNQISYELPDYGEFVHDMVGRQVLGPVYSSEQTAPAQGTSVLGMYGQTSIFPADQKQWDNTTAAKSPTFYRLVDSFGNTVLPGATYRNLVRYCEYPGERLFEQVSINIHGNPLDEYFCDAVGMLRKFTISKDKIDAYKRLVGQEVELKGYTGVEKNRIFDHDVEDSAVVEDSVYMPNGKHLLKPATNAEYLKMYFPSNTHSHADAGKSAIQNTTHPGYYTLSRRCVTALNGPQTPKLWQGELELWNKLRFWFNEDVRLSLPICTLPNGGKLITINFAKQSDLLFEAPNLFVEQTVRTSNAGKNDQIVEYRPWFVAGTINEVQMSGVELYVQNIFVDSEIHMIYVKRVSFTLIRVFKRHDERTTTAGHDNKQLTQLKWPIEYMYMGLKPTWNTDPANPNRYRDWHKFGKIVDMVSGDSTQFGYTSVDSAGNTTQLSYDCKKIIPDTFAVELPIINTIGIKSHGIQLKDNFSELFYNAYVPYQTGGANIVAPDDRGVLMINFALYPRTYQPSGYINISRARETYLEWTTSYVSTSTPAELTIIASAMNFLLITDGSAILRYAA